MGTLRIIAGKWRGRKIPVLDVAGLRPTPNMVRETLFNWLMSVIGGAVCLDLFAGSGALSFEALSRGAQQVVAVDCSKQVVRQLQQNARLLLGEEASGAVAAAEMENNNAGNNMGIIILHACMPQQISLIPPRKFNVVFLDPPFHGGFIEQTIIKLEQFSGLLRTQAEACGYNRVQAKVCEHDKAQVKACGHDNSWLADDALIYIEAEKELDVASLLPSNWKMLRRKTLGAVGYYLIERQAV